MLSGSVRKTASIIFQRNMAVCVTLGFVGGSWSRGTCHRFAVRNIVALLRSIPSLALLCVSSCSSGQLHRLRRANPRTGASSPQLNHSPGRPKGRSAPLACCLPRAAGRRCCHGALPHGMWRSGAPLTAPKDCGTKARSGVEGDNTHGS